MTPLRAGRAHPLAAAAVALALALTACADGDDPAGPAGAPAPTGTAPGAATHAIDWEGGTTDVALPNGWRAVPCEAGPTRLCVRDGAATLGVVELNEHPLASFPRVDAALRAGATIEAALRAEAETFVATFAEDRRSACGPDYTVTATEPKAVPVGGQPGLRFGFGATSGGAPVERSLQFATHQGNSLFIVSVTAVEPGSCFDDPDLDELTLEQLAAIEPVLAASVAQSPLPDGPGDDGAQPSGGPATTGAAGP